MAQTEAAGSKIYISSAANEAAANEAAFEALTWLEVGEVTNIGEFGQVYNDISTKTINQRQVKHHKGSFDIGTLDLQVYADPGDAGQVGVKAALVSDSEWGFKVTLNDQITPTTGNPTTYYFRAKVMSHKVSVADVDSMVTAKIGVAINTVPIEVDAA